MTIIQILLKLLNMKDSNNSGHSIFSPVWILAPNNGETTPKFLLQRLPEWIIDILTFSYEGPTRIQEWKSVIRAYEIPDYITDSMLWYQ